MQEYRLAQDANYEHRVQIYVTRDVSYNIDKMFQITRTVLGKLGCDGCHSEPGRGPGSGRISG